MALPRTAHASTLVHFARAARIAHRESSDRVYWEPNVEQVTTWELMREHNRLIIAKPRKTGISTAVLFDDLLWTMACDTGGNRVRCVFAIDSADKTREHFERAEGWAKDLGLHVAFKRSPPQSITFPNGSHLDFLTMGTDEPGRGGDIFRLHITELPFAAHPENAWHALRTACMDRAQIIIETTMTSLDAHVVSMWRGWKRDDVTGKTIPVATEFYRHFYKVTDQRSYRLPRVHPAGRVEPGSTYHTLRLDDGDDRVVELTAEDWAIAQRHGFEDKDRDAAAWWLLHALPNLCSGDMLELQHDYPQLEAHLFVATTGRVIEVTPRVARVVERRSLHGMSGKAWELDIYVRPKDSSGFTFVTVDTAGAKGRTRSVVLVTDISDARILAAFASSRCEPDDLARMAQLAQHVFLDGAPPNIGKRKRCVVFIESNGIGQWTISEAVKIGLPHTALDQVKVTNDHGAKACVRAARRVIETVDVHGQSVVAGPPELAEECDTLKEEKGVLVGDKDVVMTYGMALIKRQEQGIVDTEWRKRRHSPNTIHVEDRMREQRMLARNQGFYGRRV